MLSREGIPTRHNYSLGLWQSDIERILAAWVAERSVPIYRGDEVTSFAQDETGVRVAVSSSAAAKRNWRPTCALASGGAAIPNCWR